MRIKITPSDLSGTVRAPSSKSEAHRYLICAALSDAPVKICLHSPSDDVCATVDCLRALGARIIREDFGYTVIPIERVEKNARLNCRESGSTLRFLLPIAAALSADADFYAEGRLPERPLEPLASEMKRHGAGVSRHGNVISCRGMMTGREYTLCADVSSQFISGILLSSPLLGGVTVKLSGKTESSDYIRMTLDAMRCFGVESSYRDDVITVSEGKYRSPVELRVSGDWSGAAFWACAGALSKSGITCVGIDPSANQGDRRIAEIVRDMGADVSFGGDSFTVRRNLLHAISVDGSEIPDIIPPVAALAIAADGETEICNASRLRIKECDRLAAMYDIIKSVGGSVEEHEDGLTIKTSDLSGGCVSSHGDHRIAMSAALLSILCAGELTIEGAECVSKSYGAFWKDFESLGGRIERYYDIGEERYDI